MSVFAIGFWLSVLCHCWFGSRKGIRPVKTEWWGAGVVVCLERCADLHVAQLIPLPLTVFCLSKIHSPHWFYLLVPAHPGSPGQRAIKRVCMCVCVCIAIGVVFKCILFNFICE